jgi:putative sigma-54 modulation protein
MQVLITGRHVEVTSALRKYIESRMKRLERHKAKVGDVQVILGVEKYRHTAEGILSLNGTVVQAKASTKEMYASIDALFDKVVRQVSKRKQKLNSRKPLRVARTPGLAQSDSVGAQVADIKVVRPPLQRLTVTGAAEQLGEHPGAVLVFQNDVSDRMQVMRRLVNGTAELIDPDSAAAMKGR